MGNTKKILMKKCLNKKFKLLKIVSIKKSKNFQKLCIPCSRVVVFVLRDDVIDRRFRRSVTRGSVFQKVRQKMDSGRRNGMRKDRVRSRVRVVPDFSFFRTRISVVMSNLQKFELGRADLAPDSGVLRLNVILKSNLFNLQNK